MIEILKLSFNEANMINTKGHDCNNKGDWLIQESINFSPVKKGI